MTASLQMYNAPDQENANRELWHYLCKYFKLYGLSPPEELTSGSDFYEIWLDPDLFLAQTCGYPYLKKLQGRTALLVCPVYDVPGCNGAFYTSVLLTRSDSSLHSLQDFAGKTAAINGYDSQSGFVALMDSVAGVAKPKGFFHSVLETGSHVKSIETILMGSADLAAIDCVTFAAFNRRNPRQTEKLQIMGYSKPAPSLPFITSATRPKWEVNQIKMALLAALNGNIPWSIKQSLFLSGAVVPQESDFDVIKGMERRALELT